MVPPTGIGCTVFLLLRANSKSGCPRGGKDLTTRQFVDKRCGKLAIGLANALENANHVNLKLPQEQWETRREMVGTPGVVLEISNPCIGDAF